MEFRPAPADTGIVFVRADLATPICIPAQVNHRIEIPRRTSLSASGATVEMVEHIMAALSGLRIDNCEVWVDQQEMPGCDGSSQAFVEAIQKAGAQEQDAWRPRLVIDDVTRVGDNDCWVEARPARSPETVIKVRIDYSEHAAIGRQTIQMPVNPGTFTRDLAAARTFILKSEAQWLRSQGLGLRTTDQDVLVFGDQGLIGNQLRYEDECVRHKALDLLGDLALAGCDLIGYFVAHCSGHRLNAELVKALLSEGRIEAEDMRRSA